MTRRCECGKAMGAGSFRCLACARRTPAVDPTPEEIEIAKHNIRLGLVVVIDTNTGKRRMKPHWPVGGQIADTDAWEKQLREVNATKEHDAEVDDD